MSAARDITQRSDAVTELRHPLAGGGSVAIEAGAAVLRDGAGRVVIRFDGDRAEVTVPGGDLVLSAPAGAVRIAARDDLVLEGGDVVQRARGRLSVDAEDVAITAGRVTTLASQIATTAEAIVEEVGKLEVRAGRIVECSRATFREASELLQQRAGRIRTLVEGGFSLVSGHCSMRSRDETSIDGKRILLG